MPVIALVSNKGGVGKTTLSLNISAALARTYSTVIIDADPQRSSLQWHAISSNIDMPLVVAAKKNLQKQVTSLLTNYEWVIIDCPPSVHSKQTKSALIIANIALIPVQPSPLDLWAVIDVETALIEARKTNLKLQALLIINQVEVRTTISKLMPDALAELEISVASSVIRRRAIYRNSALEGKTIFQMGKRGAVAVEEFDKLIGEVINLCKE